ncbi:MAG TPA: hypothetical protein VIY51_20305 [Xanthobacteraceae bacterium]
MSSLVWILLGLGFGWWLERLYPRRPVRSPEGGSPDGIGPSAQSYLWFFVLLPVVFATAFARYFDYLPSVFYSLESFLLSPAALGLLIGCAAGLWMCRHRQTIAARSADFYQAMLGTEQQQSSWTLQLIAAAIVLLGIAMAVWPDLLGRIEFFKAGEIEAKFSNTSDATRDSASVSFEVGREMTVSQWIHFPRDYLGDSPRNQALELDNTDKEIKATRIEIRDILFNNYVMPIAILLNCLQEDDRIELLKKDQEFALMTVALRSRILSDNDTGESFTESDWRYLLGLIDKQIARLLELIDRDLPQSVRSRCEELDSMLIRDLRVNLHVYEFGDVFREFFDSARLAAAVGRATTRLRAITTTDDAGKPAFIDAYFTSAVADLVALVFGHNEKAKFLMRIKKRYPMETDYIQPGIINIYYQLSDAKLKSDALWPLDEEIEELVRAFDGAEFIVEAMRQKKAKASSEQDKKRYDKIIDVYTINKFTLLSRFLEIYYQRSLAGNVLSKPHMVKWINAFRQAESFMGAKVLGSKLSVDDIGGAPLAAQEVAEAGRVDVPAPVLFDAKVGLALSSILLTEKNRKSPNQACSVGRFYLTGASEELRDLKNEGLDEVDIIRLRGFLLQVGVRLDASC